MKTKLRVEMDVLKTILADVNITCFADIIIQKMKGIGNAEKSLITNVAVFLQLLNRYLCNMLNSRKIFFN